MHYVAAIQRRSFNLVQVHLDTPSSHMIDISGDNSDHSSYSDMCQQLPHWTLLPCLRAICQNMWQILLCYHCTIQWHKNRAAGKSSKSASKSPQLNCNPFSSDTLLMKSKQHKTKLKDGEIDSNISNNSNNNMTTGDNDSAIVITDRNSPLSKSSSVTNDDHGCDPELARQWHDYVACKLDSGRSRIWSEIISRIEPILSVVGLVARDMTFDQIASLLTTVNHFVHIGEEFCECPANELLEALRISIQKYFKDFHRKHMERLKMFLENETWEICPVKRSFTVMDLQEFRAVKDLFEQNTGSNNNNNNKYTTSGNHKTNQKITQQMFLQNRKRKKTKKWSNTNSSYEDNDDYNEENLSSAQNDLSDDKSLPVGHNGPLFSTTTLEVLRLIGRYLQMMRLLQPIAGEVMHCLCQVFDYYLYSILNLFGSPQISNSAELPERLRTTLKRINERLIAVDGHPSVLAGDRFSLPLRGPIDLFNTCNSPTEISSTVTGTNGAERECQLVHCLQIYVVSVESVICLADILETVLLPHLTACLPDNKRGLALVFREQSLMAARQIREPCATGLAPQLLNIIIPKMNDASSAKYPRQSTTSNSNASNTSSFSRIWPIGSSLSQQQNQSDKESPNTTTTANTNSPPQNPANITPVNSPLTTNSVDILAMHICALNWSTKEVANTPNTYINNINTYIFYPFSLTIQNISQKFNLQNHIMIIVIWNALLACLATQLLEAFGRVQQCSDEGRGQMLLDVQTLAVYAQSASKIRSFPRLDHVIEYIQAFYIPVHEWEHWLTNCGTKYSRAQLTGLASCLSRSDKRQYQRLLNTINQIYNNNSNNNNNNNTTNQATHSSFSNNLLANTAS
uniref:Syndetin C-terminal domain-containing protein n=1 Tax=Trichobilharzia regenti TaxID=157069 RepID=A0AA85J1L1_TRIRE|nr:unnamed protein product [Trichobilharzia regenti]